jgi:hypothetical protein
VNNKSKNVLKIIIQVSYTFQNSEIKTTSKNHPYAYYGTERASDTEIFKSKTEKKIISKTE